MRRHGILALLDMGIVFVAYLAPMAMRFEGAVPPRYWDNFRIFAPLAVLVHLGANQLFGLYGEMWKYAGVQEARRVVTSVVVAAGFLIGGDVLIPGGSQPLPRSVVVFGAMLCLMGFGAIRFQSRIFAFRRRASSSRRKRILLVGAGEAAAMIIRDIHGDPDLGLAVVGCVDDDPRKVGRAIHEVRIFGTRSAVPSLVQKLRVDQVLLAIPSASSDVVRDVAALCEESGVTLRVLPSVKELVGGKIVARDIRDLRIEDLLGRQQVQTDLESVREMLRGRRVLVTGAGGSIGSEIVRQVAAFEPASVVLVDHDETHLHDVIEKVGAGPTSSALADIRDQARTFSLFARYRPEVVFHAAAHKHVPLLESHPEEAVMTNVIGTANVVDAAVAAGVARFVFISTDKAVKPVSVMGASKWFGEQIVRSLGRNGAVFCAVRFGNVLGSRGSVIPTFLQQIARGGPVTVTDPAMQRYFMSIEEAVQLVLQAGALSTGGEVFTLEMGQPVNIHDLARRVVRLAGLVPERDIAIKIVGTRPGERLVEEITDPEEHPVPSTHPGIVVSRPSVPDRATLKRALEELELLAVHGRGDEVAAKLKASWRRPTQEAMAGGSG
jgi:FlaA1/EpsC-like NDP-sugar epimerase